MLSRFGQVHFRWFSILVILALGVVNIQPVRAQSSIDVVVHYVEGSPSERDISYEVKAFVSVVDGTGSPINDLKPGDFSLTEDSQKVEIESVTLADEPINLVLLIDTSGSMAGEGITAAKSAAASFVTSLAADDRVSVVTFDDRSNTVIDFTTDHAAARDKIALIDATRGSGTCLYDAAYQAVQATATVPSGRRAVILFTDGRDEKSGGGICSIHTADDVIKIATEGGTRTPVYTMGVGSKVDQNGLKRLAETTGGRFFYSPDSTKVDAIFRDLSNALRSQYAIIYKSTAGPGSHTLAVIAKYLSVQDTDTRGFLLPNFPLRLLFLEPKEGDQLSGTVTLKVETFGQGETIQAVVFEINGTTVASVENIPYEAQVDLSGYSEGDLTIDAVAQGADGIELDRVSQTVRVLPAVATPTSTPESADDDSTNNSFIFIGIVAFSLFAIVAVVILVVVMRRRQQKQRDDEWNRQVGGIGADMPTVDEMPAGSDKTMDSWEIPPDALGRLTVTGSDDTTMINQHFDITSRRTTLGRKADNDIIFPKDTPVSRHHAMIEEKNGGLFLTELEDPETSKRPTYGTFVNDKEVGSQSILLQSGDEIRLGKRVILKFEAGTISFGDEKTYDGLSEDTMDTRQM